MSNERWSKKGKSSEQIKQHELEIALAVSNKNKKCPLVEMYNDLCNILEQKGFETIQLTDTNLTNAKMRKQILMNLIKIIQSGRVVEEEEDDGSIEYMDIKGVKLGKHM